jgi:large subunit ribosomal protein L29
MRADEIRELTADDIQARVAELEEERFRLRFRSATETLENPLRLRTIRKDIARLKTIMTEKQTPDMAARTQRTAKKADKGADNLDIDPHRPLAPQNTGEHRDALLGEGVGGRTGGRRGACLRSQIVTSKIRPRRRKA